MTKSQDLKKFCDSFRLQFPEFIIKKDHNGIYHCTITWYKETIVVFNQFSNEDDTILSSLMYIGEWLEQDKNFIYLCMLDKEYRDKMKVHPRDEDIDII